FQTFAVTLDPTGRLYTVASGTSDNVTQYDRRDGTVLNQWSCSDGYRGANGLATDPAGNLYLGMGLKVDFVDPLGHALGSLPVAPSYVATAPSGSIYALSMYGLLTKFSARHEPLNTLHLGAYGNGGYYMGVAASPSG